MKRTALKRKTRIKPRRSTPRRSSRVRDVEYMLAVKQLPCCAKNLGPRVWTRCTPGPIHAHHAGYRGVGQKADDTSCIPLCWFHHASWHDCCGPFNGWTHDQRADWAAAQILATQHAVSLRRDRGTAIDF